MSTEKRNDLKNQLAKTAGSMPDKPRTPQQLVGDYLNKMMPTIAQVLPKHADADRMSRIALNVIRTNPQLLQCNIESLMGGVLEAAKLGLEPGMLGQCYLIPFNNRKQNRMEAQFVIGYRGLIDLVRRSGQVSTIEAREVCENDEFEYEYGIDDKLVHKPAKFGTERGSVIGYYAVAKLKDGGYSFLVMSKQEVEKHRDKHAKAKSFGPWVDEFDAMAKKTVLRQLIKYLPISIEYLSNDEASGAEVHRAIDPDAPIIEMNIDHETGEIINVEAEVTNE